MFCACSWLSQKFGFCTSFSNSRIYLAFLSMSKQPRCFGDFARKLLYLFYNILHKNRHPEQVIRSLPAQEDAVKDPGDNYCNKLRRDPSLHSSTITSSRLFRMTWVYYSLSTNSASSSIISPLWYTFNRTTSSGL